MCKSLKNHNLKISKPIVSSNVQKKNSYFLSSVKFDIIDIQCLLVLTTVFLSVLASTLYSKQLKF